MSFQISSLVLVALLFLQCVTARELVPVRPSSGGIGKRAETALELQSSEIFLWGDATDGEAILANFTVYMPGQTENILAMEKFNGMLKSVDCNCANGLSFTFKDDATFNYAQKVWDWVNGADNHTFVMVAGVGDCGNNTNRIPFVVSRLNYDEEANTAHLTASKSDWTTVAHSYDLVVGSIPKASLNVRDITKNLDVDVNHSFPFSVTASSGPLSLGLACTNCSTSGSFAMEFKISTKLFIPTGASMTVTPQGVSAIAQIKLTGTGSVSGDFGKTWDLFKIPVDGITIAGILDLGPFLVFSVGFQVGPLQVSAGIQSGATAVISDSAILNVDLLKPSTNHFSGWEPILDTLPVTVDGRVSGAVSIFSQASLQLRADALGHGFEIGVNLRVPNLNAKLEVIEAPAGACPNVPAGTERHTNGVRISANIGAQFNLAVATTSDEGDPFLNLQIATLDKTLAQECWEFGPVVASTTTTTLPTNGTYATKAPSRMMMPRYREVLV